MSCTLLLKVTNSNSHETRLFILYCIFSVKLKLCPHFYYESNIIINVAASKHLHTHPLRCFIP